MKYCDTSYVLAECNTHKKPKTNCCARVQFPDHEKLTHFNTLCRFVSTYHLHESPLHRLRCWRTALCLASPLHWLRSWRTALCLAGRRSGAGCLWLLRQCQLQVIAHNEILRHFVRIGRMWYTLKGQNQTALHMSNFLTMAKNRYILAWDDKCFGSYLSPVHLLRSFALLV